MSSPQPSPPATIASTMSEADLLASVIEMARWLGWRAYHTWRSVHSAAGYPDVTLVRAGLPGAPPRVIWAELKRDGRHPTAAQQAWLDDLGRVAAFAALLGQPGLITVVVWKPSDWLSGEIERVLR